MLSIDPSFGLIPLLPLAPPFLPGALRVSMESTRP